MTHIDQLQSMLNDIGVKFNVIEYDDVGLIAIGFVPQQYSGCFALDANLRTIFYFDKNGKITSVVAEEVEK